MKKEKKIYRKQQNSKKKMMMLLATVLFITIGSIGFGSSFSDAHESKEEQTIVYKSILIQSGDTLWDIAQEYKTNDYESTQDYVDELKRLNSLESDQIQESKYLTVACYEK